MRIPSALLVAALLLPTFPARGSAFEVLRQSPSFDSRKVLTQDPLTVVFDRSLDPDSVHSGSFYVISAEAGVLRRSSLPGAGEGVVTPRTTGGAPMEGPSPARDANSRISKLVLGLLDTPRAGASVPGSIALISTTLPNDTVVFTPTEPWRWGQRYRLTVTSRVLSLEGEPFNGNLPYDGIFVANIPNDFILPGAPPGTPIDTNSLVGFNPADPESPADPWQIPGANVTGAWKYSLGTPDVIVALVDDGILDYEDPEIRRTFFLNAGELPPPEPGGHPCPSYDCNGDGRFDADDYADDPRLLGLQPVSAFDLIQVFSNGADEDGNGLADDISGWDFLRGVNQVLGIPEVPELGAHGDGQMRTIASQGDNGIGTRPGVCPECRVLVVRAGANIIYDYGLLAAAVRYASSMGASVITLAGANFTWSEQGHRAFLDALEAGAITVAASGDEMTFHHWMPAAGEEIMSVKAIFPALALEPLAFTATFCTNYGPHVQVAMPADSFCSSEGTASVAGMAGLLASYAREVGLDLQADEVKQILTMTAYDIRDRCASVAIGLNACQEGFDEQFGYGRPDLGAAMLALGDPDFGIEPAIPPSVRIIEPRWWESADPNEASDLEVRGEIRSRVVPCLWRLEVARGGQPREEDFLVVASGTANGPIEGFLGSIPLADLPDTKISTSVTVRAQAFYESASRGRITGEARKTVSVFPDSDPLTGPVPGFPMELGASGESSPVLYDLDGDPDQRLEIVFGTGAGAVVALKYDARDLAWAEMFGFPLDLSGDDPWVKEAIFASVAVGDLTGDGGPEIVAATTGGKVYAIDPRRAGGPGGALLPGFPVLADSCDNTSAFSFFHGNGFMASPVLVDLDLDGMLEIVAASLDQKVYAWKPIGESGQAERLAGWPVVCRSLPGLVPDDSVCEGTSFPYPIFGTPAAGILDPASPDPHISRYPSVVVASNEACQGPLLAQTRVYAIYHDGAAHEGGTAFLPGWPAKPTAPFSTLLPIPFIAGAAASPAVLVRTDGATVAVGTTGWFPQFVRYANGQVRSEDIPLLLDINAIGSPNFSSLLGDGSTQSVFPMTGPIRIDEAGFQVFNSSLIALNVDSPNEVVLTGKVEDIPMLTACSVADLDNNGTREVLGGTGGYWVHAFSADGTEAPGWPKFTLKWASAAPAVGDLDADGKIEIVETTREGALYAWESEGLACPSGLPNSDWRRYHHDERNTGFYGADTVPPARIVDIRATRLDADTLRLDFTAPGNDWSCGMAAAYEVRYTTRADADLSVPEEFSRFPLAGQVPATAQAGETQSLVVRAPGASRLAVRALDGAGNLSLPSNDPLAQGSGRGWGDNGGGCGCALFGETGEHDFLKNATPGLLYLLPFAYLFSRRRGCRDRRRSEQP